jgi:hypothetical protein
MVRRIPALLSCFLLASCASNGDFKNPFEKDKPFVATVVPSDFAIVVDEGHFTFTTRQHIQQVITAADSMSRTTYTNFQEFNDAVRNRFTIETSLTPAQLQDLWNEVIRNNLMSGSTIWINWRSDSDLYKKNEYTIQLRANGRTRTYRQTNGFSGSVRDLMLRVDAVRLPTSQDSTTPVVSAEAPATMSSTVPAATTPASAPAAAAPETAPATSTATKPESN